MTVNHPTKMLVEVETALIEWNRAGGICQEKKDGCFAVYQVEDFTVTAEKMADGEIFAFDLVSIGGGDMRGEPLDVRWFELNARAGALAADGIKIVPGVPSERGADFLKSVLDSGGEGFIRKS